MDEIYKFLDKKKENWDLPVTKKENSRIRWFHRQILPNTDEN